MHRAGTSLYLQIPKSESDHIADLLPTNSPNRSPNWPSLVDNCLRESLGLHIYFLFLGLIIPICLTHL